MRRRFFVLLAFMMISVCSFSTNALAYENHSDHEHAFVMNGSAENVFMNESEFEQFMTEHQIGVSLFANCCSNPNLKWKHTKTLHIYPQGGGFCLSLAAVGDEYCTNCSKVLRTDIIFDQVFYGCGAVHT